MLSNNQFIIFLLERRNIWYKNCIIIIVLKKGRVFMTNKIIIIGTGAAGNAALEEIVKEKGSFDITVLSKESGISYYRPMLSEYIGLDTLPKRFYLHTPEWYAENNVTLMTDVAVKEILPDQNKVVLDDKSLQYDTLILATGSNNFIPPMPGASLEKVVSLRSLKDAERIKSLAKDSKKTVIIGGGLLGLELGWQLVQVGVAVDVVEMMDRLLPRQLDPEASALFEEKVAAAGINVLKGVQTKGITGTDTATGVELADGTVLDADFVAFSIGVRADVSLAKSSGIQTDRGILVDDHMRTNINNIFAAGDCAEYKGINYAIWPEAVDQGKVAGQNAIGKRSIYEPIIPFNIYHGMNMRLFSIGDVGGNPGLDYDTYVVKDDRHFEKYFFVDDTLVGGILLDDISKSSKLKNAMIKKESKKEFLESIE